MKLMRLLVLSLVAILFFSALQFAGQNNVLRICTATNTFGLGSTILSQFFDNETTGTTPTGWQLFYPPSFLTIDDTVAYNSTGKAAKFSSQPAPSGPGYAIRPFESQTGIVQVECELRSDSQWFHFRLDNDPVLDLGAHTHSGSPDIMFVSGKIYANSVDGGVMIQDFIEGAWYKIVLVINLYNQTYEFYLDDALKASSIPISISEVRNVVVGSEGTLQYCYGYIDNLVIQKNVVVVPHDYPTIQEAINAASEGDTVFVRNGTYDGSLSIGKTLTLLGEDRTSTVINGESGISILADNVRISGFTVQHISPGSVGIDGYVNMTFSDNIMLGNDQGIRLIHTSGCAIVNNVIDGNSIGSVGFDWANNNLVFNNTMTNCAVGIHGGYPSYNNTFLENTIINNTHAGIEMNNFFNGNRFYHNNIINNTIQVDFTGIQGNNTWDNEYPSGGNFWSDYNGTDADNDGIGDASYTIDANNTDNYPLMNPWAPPDIAVRDLSTSKTIIGQGCTGALNVTLENQGNKIEAFNTSVHANSTVIQSESTMLTMVNQTFSFIWNTTGFAYGNYTINAYVEPLLEETDISDNNCTCSFTVHVGVPGDISGPIQGVYDGKCDMRDINYLIVHFNSKPISSNWDPNADVNNDGTLNMRDIQIAILNFNKHE